MSPGRKLWRSGTSLSGSSTASGTSGGSHQSSLRAMARSSGPLYGGERSAPPSAEQLEEDDVGHEAVVRSRDRHADVEVDHRLPGTEEGPLQPHPAQELVVEVRLVV